MGQRPDGSSQITVVPERRRLPVAAGDDQCVCVGAGPHQAVGGEGGGSRSNKSRSFKIGEGARNRQVNRA